MKEAERKLFYAGAAVVFMIVFGAVVFHALEQWDWLDSVYFSVVTLSTVGYGDLVPHQPATKMFIIIYILAGVAIVLYSLNTIGQYWVEKRELQLYERMNEFRKYGFKGKQLYKFPAVVESGMSKAAGFLSHPYYSEELSKILGETPFAGTLNARASAEEVKLLKNSNSFTRISQTEKNGKKLGGVSCLKAVVISPTASQKCLLVFPDKSGHGPDVIEIVAAVNLRKKLSVQDGDKISIELSD